MCCAKVTFPSGGETERQGRLSGGKQTVLALSLIFAIQRCDPSPFYLFDEIDSALDALYRSSVSNMIKEESKKTQFITTTFRSEMISSGDQFYGVVFTNKESVITVLTLEQAKALVQVVEKEMEERRSTGKDKDKSKGTGGGGGGGEEEKDSSVMGISTSAAISSSAGPV